MTIDVLDLPDLLISLADKGLVTMTGRDGKARYGLTESVRQYARDRFLAEGAGDDAAVSGGAYRDRHVACYLALAEQAEPHLTGRHQLAWMERLEEEHGNLRAALQWCVEAPGPDDRGVRLAGALWRFWQVRGYLTEGRAWLSGVLAADATAPATAARAKAVGGAGSLAHGQSDYSAARSLHEECLAMRRQLGDMPAVASALNNLGLVALAQGDLEGAREQLERCIAIQRQTGHTWGLAIGLTNLGIVAKALGDFPGARRLLEQSLPLLHELGDLKGIAGTLNSLGHMTMALGDYSSAQTHFEKSGQMFRELNDRLSLESSVSGMGSLAFYQGDYTTAREKFTECLTISREIGVRNGIANALNCLGNVAHMQTTFLAHWRVSGNRFPSIAR